MLSHYQEPIADLNEQIIVLNKELERKNDLISRLITHAAHMDALVESLQWNDQDLLDKSTTDTQDHWDSLPDGLKVAIESKYEEMYLGMDGDE